MRSAPLCRPLDLPLDGFSITPFLTRKETAASNREDENPKCRSSIFRESKSCSRSCCRTSKASICFSNCRCCGPLGEELTGRVLAMGNYRLILGTKLSLFTKSVKLKLPRPRRDIAVGKTSLAGSISSMQQAENGRCERGINRTPQYRGGAQRPQPDPRNSKLTALQQTF